MEARAAAEKEEEEARTENKERGKEEKEAGEDHALTTGSRAFHHANIHLVSFVAPAAPSPAKSCQGPVPTGGWKEEMTK